jgi:hypothetical protein
MKKVTVVQTPRMDRFEQLTNNLLADGWDLHGSPFVSQTGAVTQLMVKNLESKEEKNVPGRTTKKTGGSV